MNRVIESKIGGRELTFLELDKEMVDLGFASIFDEGLQRGEELLSHTIYYKNEEESKQVLIVISFVDGEETLAEEESLEKDNSWPLENLYFVVRGVFNL